MIVQDEQEGKQGAGYAEETLAQLAMIILRNTQVDIHIRTFCIGIFFIFFVKII
jgi:hypothetical protein